MYTIYVNNTLPLALAVHEIYRDIFGPSIHASFLCFHPGCSFCLDISICSQDMGKKKISKVGLSIVF